MSAALWIAAASVAADILGNQSTNRANLRNTRENNAHQLMMSSTAHQREVKDLQQAGLNPILSARGAGAPVGSSAAARVEPYKKVDVGSALVQAEQIKLLEAQSRKTNAEALNTELQEPYNRAMHDLYDSILGGAAVTGKAVGGIATGMGMYQGAKAVSRMLKARKAKNASVPKSKPLTNLQKQKLRKLHKMKTKSRNRYGLRPGEYIDKRTGEIKSRSFRSEALKKAAKSTKYGLRRFGGRRFRFR